MKLPEIVYGKVEGLGRYGSNLPSIITKTGAVEANAVETAGKEKANSMQKSSQILGQSITQAGSYEAKGILAAETNKNNTIMRHEKAQFALDISRETALGNVAIQTAASFAKLAVSSYAQSKTKESELKFAENSTIASTNVQTVSDFVGAKDKVNIADPLISELAAEYSGDFISTTNPQTGETMKMVDTYKVQGLIMKNLMSEVRTGAVQGLEGEYLQKMDAKMNILEGTTMSKAFLDSRASFNRVIKQQTGVQIKKNIHNGNFVEAGNITDAAEAVGNLSVKEAGAFRTQISDVKEADGFARGIETFDIERGVVPTKAIASFREEIRNSQNPDKKSLISALNTKENRLKANAKTYEAKVKARRAFRIGADVIADMQGSLTIEEVSRTGGRTSTELVASVVAAAEARGLEGRELSQVQTGARAALNNSFIDHSAHINAAANNWWKKFDEDQGFIEPPITVPGMSSQTIRSQNKAWNARIDGRDVTTDMKTYTGLLVTAEEHPDRFPSASKLRLEYSGLLNDTALREMIKLSGSLKKDPEMTKLKSADVNFLFDKFARENYGDNYKKGGVKTEQANNMRYAMDSMLWQMEDATVQEKREAIKDLFTYKDVIFKKPPMFSHDQYNNKTVKTIAESDIEAHMPKIIRAIEAVGAAITGESIVKTYNLMVKKGEITF